MLGSRRDQARCVAGEPRRIRKCVLSELIYCGCEGENLIPYTEICIRDWQRIP
jgi:hypothetical protein